MQHGSRSCEYRALMRHRREVASTLEYPRPVLPAGLTEDEQDELLDQLMDRLISGESVESAERPSHR